MDTQGILYQVHRFGRKQLVVLVFACLAACLVGLIYLNELAKERDRNAAAAFLSAPERFFGNSTKGRLGLPSRPEGLLDLLGADKLDEDHYESVSGADPQVDICLQEACEEGTQRIRLRLAYPLHLERAHAPDSWDLVFAPIQGETFTHDSTRLVFRISDSAGRGFGYLYASKAANRGMGLEPSGATVRLVDFWRSDVGKLAASYASRERMALANHGHVPLRVLRHHSDLIDRNRGPDIPLGPQVKSLVDGPAGDWFLDSLPVAWPSLVSQIILALISAIGGLALFLHRKKEDK